jgi:heptosyltransferase-3
MRLLFVKPQRIGDTLILTPTLRAVKESYPEAEIWVLVRRETAGILAGCPDVDHVLTLAGSGDKKINLRTLREGFRDIWRMRKVRFDYVFELTDHHRGRLFASLARARRRYSLKLFGKMSRWERWRFKAQSTFAWRDSHLVEKDFFSVAEFLPLADKTPPAMVFDRALTQAWPEGGDLSDCCVLQIGTWKDYSRWSRERWREVAFYLLEHFDRIVISTGSAAHEMEDAAWLARELGTRSIATMGRTTWPQVAGLLYQARLYVGHDTATMHLAAACECPIVALFATTEHRYFPWKGNFRAVFPEEYRGISDPVARAKLRQVPKLHEIMSRDVIEACGEMLGSIRNGKPKARQGL